MSGTSTDAVEELDAPLCWLLLASATLGRVAVAADDGVDIYPVNFLVCGEAIYFSSAPGKKMMQLTANPRVAFEVDGTSERRRWSVVVRGRAARIRLRN
jgi:nitroimidazol reductase NimA-like FMN-containing flavoprotein (pyridoxamine 5'-phosphate oxidase superfamily)